MVYGIVRRIDDLGRIVIPKTIRDAIQCPDFQPFVIEVDKNGRIILTPYNPEEYVPKRE